MPDLTGSSFRTGVDMAASGETVPVSFTVENRGGADPGNFQVQVLLSDSNSSTARRRCWRRYTRAELVADATGRDFSSPAGFSVTVPAGWASGPAYLGLRIVADPAVPEAGLYDKSGVHRGVGLGAAHGRHPRDRRRPPTCRRSTPASTRKTPARPARARTGPTRSR